MESIHRIDLCAFKETIAFKIDDMRDSVSDLDTKRAHRDALLQ